MYARSLTPAAQAGRSTDGEGVKSRATVPRTVARYAVPISYQPPSSRQKRCAPSEMPASNRPGTDVAHSWSCGAARP